MNKVQNILLGLLLIAGLAGCKANTPAANTSAESRRGTLAAQKEQLINKLDDQIVEILDIMHRDQEKEFRWGESNAPDQDQAASAVKLLLSGLCGCLESKEVENVALRKYMERFVREDEGDVNIFHFFMEMLDGDLSEASSKWLTGFLKELPDISLGEVEAKMLLKRIFEDMHSLFKVMKEIRQLT
jgi:hypothetical protein